MSRIILVLASVVILPSVVAAHPAHVAIAEAEWNRETGMLEVALRLRPEDVEEALTRMVREGRVNLDRTKDVDKHLQAYLRPRFVVKYKGKSQPLKWVGKEVGLRHAWLYFEIPAPPQEALDTADCQLSCTVLMDLLPDQANTVLLKDGERRWSLQFTRHAPIQTMKKP